MSIWFSSGAFNSRDIEGVLAEADRLGIEGIELSSGMAHDAEFIGPVMLAYTSGEHRFLVHNYFPPPAVPFVLNIAALDEENRRKSKAHGLAALDLSRRLGASFYSIHGGFAAVLKAEQLGKPLEQASSLTAADIDRDGAYMIMLDTVRELADAAAVQGLDLLIENNVISPVYLEKMPVNPLLLTEANEIVQFFSDVDRPNVGMLLDVAHAKVSGTALGFAPESFVEIVADYVKALHLSDNDGREDTNQPFQADAWFMPFLKDFRNLEVVVEAYRLEPSTMLQQRDLLERALSQ